jgi:hypothetical protein
MTDASITGERGTADWNKLLLRHFLGGKSRRIGPADLRQKEA